MKLQIAIKYLLSCLYLFLTIRSGSSLIQEFTVYEFQRLVFYGTFLWASSQIKIYKKAYLNLTTFVVTIAHFTFPIFFNFNNLIFRANEMMAISQILFSFGIAISTLAILDLGKSFTLFPNHSKLIQEGIYCFVRHPIYLGYIFMIASLIVAYPSLWNLILVLPFFGLTALRIQMEEKAMMVDVSYSDYKNRVPYRLIPWIY